MARRAAAVLVVLALAVPTVYAQQPATSIRDAIAHVRFDDEAPSPSIRARRRVSGHRLHADAAVVAALAVLGMYGGMLVTAHVALPCHCDDPESVVARGGLVGALGGFATGMMLTSR